MIRFGLPALGFRAVTARKARTLVATLGIVLGVASIVALNVAMGSLDQSLLDFFAEAAGNASLSVTPEGARPFRLRVADDIIAFPGVDRISVSTIDAVSIRSADGKKTVGLTVAGVDPDSDPGVRTYIFSAGRFLSARENAYNIVLSESFAKDNGIALDSRLPLLLNDGRELEFRVIGLLTDTGAGHMYQGKVAFVSITVAQEIFDKGGRLNQVDVVVSPEIKRSTVLLDQMKADLQAYLGKDYIVDYPSAMGKSISEMMGGMNQALSIFGVIAVFVGALVIYNTFNMTTTERIPEFGALRALGATKGQVMRMMLVEALLTGVIGTALGIGAGVLIAPMLIGLLGNGFQGLTLEAFKVTSGTVITGVAVGLGVTIVAALLPAWQGSRVSPVEALRSRAKDRPSFVARHGWKISLPLLAFCLTPLSALPGLAVMPFLVGSLGVLAVGLLWRRFGRLGGRVAGVAHALRQVWMLGAIGLGLTLPAATPIMDVLPDASMFLFFFVGGIMLVPAVIILSERAVRALLKLLYGQAGALGSRNLARAAGRTSLTVGVLMIAVIMILDIGTLQSSFGYSLTKWINNAIGGDLVVAGARPMSRSVGSALGATPGVQAVTSTYNFAETVVGGVNDGEFRPQSNILGVEIMDPATHDLIGEFQFTEDADKKDEIMARMRQGEAILVGSAAQTRYSLKKGDYLRVRTRRGEVDFEVAGFITSFNYAGNNFVISTADAARYFGMDRAYAYLVKLAPGAEAKAVTDQINDRLGRRADFEIIQADTFRASLMASVTSFMSIFNAVVWVSVLAAALGVINTMTVSVLERVRELGVLRSVGMTRAQIARMVLAEAAAMGLIACLFGAPLGSLISRDMIVGAAGATGFQLDYVYPWDQLAIGILLAVFLSQAASLYPVWRAARLQVVAAISHE